MWFQLVLMLHKWRNQGVFVIGSNFGPSKLWMTRSWDGGSDTFSCQEGREEKSEREINSSETASFLRVHFSGMEFIRVVLDRELEHSMDGSTLSTATKGFCLDGKSSRSYISFLLTSQDDGHDYELQIGIFSPPNFSLPPSLSLHNCPPQLLLLFTEWSSLHFQLNVFSNNTNWTKVKSRDENQESNVPLLLTLFFV